MKKIKVLFAAAELTPMAKVGGLGDVIGALPKNLIKHGVDVRIVIPKYGIIKEKKYNLKKITSDTIVPFMGQEEKINIWQSYLPQSQVPVYFIENFKYLGQNGIYFEKDASPGGSSSECQRFTFFARSLFETFTPINFWPDIIHCHDWHVGTLPFLKKYLAKKNKNLEKIKTLLTIHNLAYQGIYSFSEVLRCLEISEKEAYETGFIPFEKENINYLRQAIIHADLINTVSPTYAQEILTPEYGNGLTEDLKKRKNDLYGILNGIDLERFNPEIDPEIVKKYSLKTLANKKINKRYLQEISGLEVNENIPLLGFVGRLAEQKGIDLILEALPELEKENCQLVFLGTGNPDLENSLKETAKKYKGKVSVTIAFDASLAQKIYAGSDIFLMPSRFEPCGLGQMIAMRYGTIPIVRATGGLVDTVQEFEKNKAKGTGFLFSSFLKSAFLSAVKKALSLYSEKKLWQIIMENAMKQDFSWDKSSKEYLKLYKKLI